MKNTTVDKLSFATEEQKAFKQGYKKGFEDGQKQVEAIKARAREKLAVAQKMLDEIPEEFTTLQEAEDYQFFSGQGLVIKDLLNFIEKGEKESGKD